ncbi:MAG: hypothetical protein WAJ91_12720 [Rhodoplanes sp.]
MLAGGEFWLLLRRLWPMMLGIVAGTAAGANFLTGGNANAAVAALGAALMIYAGLGLGSVRFKAPPHAETWLAPLIGIATGLITAGTGVFAIPARALFAGDRVIARPTGAGAGTLLPSRRLRSRRSSPAEVHFPWRRQEYPRCKSCPRSSGWSPDNGCAGGCSPQSFSSVSFLAF